MFYKFRDFIPFADASSFVHPLAAVTGNVEIGRNVYIGPGAAIRGDFGKIIIEDGSNVQENCVVHSFPGATVILHENAHIGHGAILHGCTIGRNCLVGMNAVIMDEVELGEECIVGALSFIGQRAVFERRSLIVGNPARKIKEVSDEMISWKAEGTRVYQQLAADMLLHFEACEPLREKSDAQIQQRGYRPWKKRQ
ncbi:MAG TPA: transferase hexapeptide repeat family protein [Ginsengibacter sp.]|nr:transferase hexapeptide repeat family protein [Ginsengibacter sp.]HRP16617.1 transferase hexapeptide repeat family protein [Ginsengibacter sp.]HRP45214.1 transferase hexapeptide repeat family protein [Ginsengibacter sp.]